MTTIPFCFDYGEETEVEIFEPLESPRPNTVPTPDPVKTPEKEPVKV